MTDHTRTEKIGGDSIVFLWSSKSWRETVMIVLISPEEEYDPFTTKLKFDSTNNVAEYEACIMGLQVTMAKKVKNLKVYGDSTLVIYQLRGDWLTRDSRMILYHKLAMEMIDKFKVISFEHLPYEKTKWQMH